MEYSHSPEHEASHSGWTTTTKLVVVIFIMILSGLALYAFRVVVVPLILAGIVAFVLYPVVQFFSRISGLSHKLVTGLVYLVMLAGLVVVVAVVTPIVIDQVDSFQQEELEDIIAFFDDQGDRSYDVLGVEVEAQSVVDEITNALEGLGRSLAGNIVHIALGVAELLLIVFFIFLMSFYLTSDADEFWEKGRSLIPLEYRRDADLLLSELGDVWRAFFRGQLILAGLVTILITVEAAAIGLPRPILWGILAGFMEFLPSVGHTIWIVIASIVAFIVGSSTLPVSNIAFVAIVAGAHLVFTKFDLAYLIPRILGSRVHLHPMVVIIGIIIGASIGGVLGVALATPVIASARVFGRYIYCRLFGIDPFAYAAVTVPDAAALDEPMESVSKKETVVDARPKVETQESAL